MERVSLHCSTGNTLIDSTLQATVSAYEAAFPGRVRSYYLLGSYVEGTAVPLSDIDCFVIFANAFLSEEEAAQAEHIGQQCAAASPIRLDLGSYPENELAQLHAVMRIALKSGSSIIYGDDIRAAIPLPPLSDYITALIQGAQYFMALLHGETHLTEAALDYPIVTDPFFGYTHKRVAAWYPPTIDTGTKELVATVSRIASAIVAQEKHLYIPGKQAAFILFRTQVGGVWAPFVEQIYTQCKLAWHYRVPTTASDQEQLRSLCQQMLAFEKMFLQTYCSIN